MLMELEPANEPSIRHQLSSKAKKGFKKVSYMQMQIYIFSHRNVFLKNLYLRKFRKIISNY